MLRTFLAQELTRLELATVDLIVPSLAGPEPKPIEFAPFFYSLSCVAGNTAGLVDEQKQYLRRICEFKKFNPMSAQMSTVWSFLYRTGGLYRDVPTDINVTIRHQEITTELSRLEQLVLAVKNNIGTVQLLVYGAITDAQKAKLVAAIESLEARRAALEAAYDARKNDPGVLGSLKVVVDAGKNLATAVGAIHSSDWLQVGQNLEAGMQGLGEVLTASRIPSPAPNFAELDDAIKRARDELDAFQAAVYQTRREIVGSQKSESTRTYSNTRSFGTAPYDGTLRVRQPYQGSYARISANVRYASARSKSSPYQIFI